MAPPFWEELAGAGVFWVFLPALIKDYRFVDPEAFSDP
jgi:hypothetical protein